VPGTRMPCAASRSSIQQQTRLQRTGHGWS